MLCGLLCALLCALLAARLARVTRHRRRRRLAALPEGRVQRINLPNVGLVLAVGVARKKLNVLVARQTRLGCCGGGGCEESGSSGAVTERQGSQTRSSARTAHEHA